MTTSFQLPISNYQFTLNDQLPMINVATAASNGKWLNVNLLKIVNCLPAMPAWQAGKLNIEHRRCV